MRIAILTILSVPVHEHEMSHHLFISSIFSTMFCAIQGTSISLLLFRRISKYSFWYYREWNCSLNFIFRLFFANDKYTIEFCIFVLYPVTLLKLFILVGMCVSVSISVSVCIP